ncbi:MAG: RDD family protein [Bryobacteraceae bacterium]
MTEAALTLRVRLSQGVTFSLPLAGPVTRCFAFFIDMFIVVAILGAFDRIISLAVKVSQDFGTGLIILGYFATWTLYGMFCEYYWQGQTLGKWLFGLRVMDTAGLQLQFHQVAIRNLVRTIDLLPLLGVVGGLTMLLNSRLQRLGDIAAGTVVIRTRRAAQPNLEALARGRYNSFLAHQVLCARLRQRVPAAIAALAVDALLRRDKLDDLPRVALFDDFADYFRSVVEFPAEDTEQLTSEQYVRNAVEVLHQKNS